MHRWLDLVWFDNFFLYFSLISNIHIYKFSHSPKPTHNTVPGRFCSVFSCLSHRLPHAAPLLWPSMERHAVCTVLQCGARSQVCYFWQSADWPIFKVTPGVVVGKPAVSFLGEGPGQLGSLLFFICEYHPLQLCLTLIKHCLVFPLQHVIPILDNVCSLLYSVQISTEILYM